MTCGAVISAEAATGREARKTVTVLFADVSGFTPLGERLDVESLRLVMSRYFARMREAVERHEGTVEKFIGDAVMAVFGMRQIHEDDALRAVRAAADMREALTRLNPELDRDLGVTLAIRIGVNTGEVVVSDSRSGSELVIGDAVNLAARLEQLAQPGDILVGDATYRLVRDAVTVEKMEPQLVKGKSEAVHAVRLVAVIPGAPALARRLDSPMVGRQRELETLRQTHARSVSDRACHLITILGSAGVGKSRLVEEFLQMVGGQARVLRGHCLSYGEGITFLPVQEVLRDAATTTDKDSTAAVMAKVTELADGLEHSDLILRGVSHLLGAPGSPPASEETQWAVRKLLESLARSHPLVIIFDDLHWGESTFLDLVEHIAEWSRGVSMLLVCTARQELLDARPTWGGGKLNATTMLLEPLTDQESIHLLTTLVGEARLGEEIRGRIVDSAEGNPLFLEEMLAMLIDNQVLTRRNGHWLAVGDPAKIDVPPSIRALLTARLDRLNQGERQVIECAAVVGRVFAREAVIHLCSEAVRPEVPANVQALVRKDLIRAEESSWRGDEVFRFRHALTREAAYGTVAKQARSELHERFADWLDAKPEERAKSDEIAAYHLEQAYHYRVELGPPDQHATDLGRRAAQRLAAAGGRASVQGDVPAAIRLFSRANAILAADSRERLALLPELGAALVEAGDFGAAERVLTEALEGAAHFGDRGLAAYAMVERERLRTIVDPEGSSERALTEAHEAIVVFEAEGDDRGLALAWQLLGEVHQVHGQLGAQHQALLRALTYAQRVGERRLEAGIQIAITGGLFFGPASAEECGQHCERVLARARANGSRLVEAFALYGLGLLRAQGGQFAKARELVSKGRAILDDLGMKVRIGTLSLVAGSLEMLADDPVSAERELRHGCAVLFQAGEKAVLSTVVADLADAVYAQSRYVEALELTQTSEAAAASDDAFSQVLWRSTRAKVYAHQGRGDDGVRLAREAVAIAERTEYLELLARALSSLGVVLQVAGLVDDAQLAVSKAASLYERKGNVVMRDRLSAVLQQR
jgi:class 3 adenylate cyclase/tetratricopeptide (TPR) repeat protein